MKLGEWIIDQANKSNIKGSKIDIIKFAKTIQKNRFSNVDMIKALKQIEEL